MNVRPVLAALLLLPLTAAAGGATPDPLRIAVIDTGIDPNHPEFGAGQIVAWKDFTPENSATPQDGHGHGTATASLVAGLNAGNCGNNALRPKLSFAPGAQLIIARVGDDGGAITGDITAAFDWAVAQGADVISMSIGGIVPLPAFTANGIQRARAAGVVVVVSAGNGLGNLGTAPYPSWTTTYGNSDDVISVGASSRSGGPSLIGNLDPDVSSWGSAVCVARRGGGYTTMSGTSFAAPLVAGMAGKAIEEARANGQASNADRIERLVLLSATNNPATPYALQGMGFLLDAEFPRLVAHARAGTLPDYDAQGQHAALDRQYHDDVLEPVRNVI